MTLEELEKEISHLLTKEEFYKTFGDFRADLIKTIWITQLSTIGIILIGVGLLLHFHI